jgi:hypothetical protein
VNDATHIDDDLDPGSVVNPDGSTGQVEVDPTSGANPARSRVQTGVDLPCVATVPVRSRSLTKLTGERRLAGKG